MLDLNIHAPDTPHETLHASLMETGYIIIEELAVDLAARTRDEVTPHIDAAAFGHNEFLGFHTKRVDSVLKKSRSPHANSLSTRPRWRCAN